MLRHDVTGRAGGQKQGSTGNKELGWQQQVTLYSTSSPEQLRALYSLRRQCLREQTERQVHGQRHQEFIRYLVQTGQLSG